MTRASLLSIAVAVVPGLCCVAHAQSRSSHSPDIAPVYVAPLDGDLETLRSDGAPVVKTGFSTSRANNDCASDCCDKSNDGCGCEASCDGCDSCGCSGAKKCGCCDCKKIKAAKAKAAGAYKGVFYANDYSYINDPCYRDHLLGDSLKQIDVGCRGKLDVGGQLRLRYHHELGMKGPQRFQAGTDDDFLLTRLRLFGNYRATDNLRFYVEGLYADSEGETYAPRPIDQNSMDFQNFFVDYKLGDAFTVRAGRQELLYGAQRTISPLDWANTRRTFEGIRVLYKRGDWAIDGFFTNFVPVQPNDIDEANYDLPFYGAYGVYSGLDNATADFYYLGSENNTTRQALHTIGGRLNGACPCSDWLYEVEGATQFGSRGNGLDQDNEHFVTAGVGRKLSECGWSPTVWLYYDYASENYNQLYPLAHKYLGFIDAVQRSNIESPNVLLTMKPSDKVKLLFWYYHFESASANPVRSIGGTPNQTAGKHFGDELDVVVKYQIKPRTDILFGWSHLWRGSKINAAINTQDADFFYTQLQVNF